MRAPTPLYEAMAWWRNALDGQQVPMIDGEPQPGFYRRKLVKGGPYVAARIWIEQHVDPVTGELDRDEILLCEVDGQPRDAADQWVWLCANPISEADYRLMRDRAGWARAHAEDHPAANPERAVDWSTARIPF